MSEIQAHQLQLLKMPHRDRTIRQSPTPRGLQHFLTVSPGRGFSWLSTAAILASCSSFLSVCTVLRAESISIGPQASWACQQSWEYVYQGCRGKASLVLCNVQNAFLDVPRDSSTLATGSKWSKRFLIALPASLRTTVLTSRNNQLCMLQKWIYLKSPGSYFDLRCICCSN